MPLEEDLIEGLKLTRQSGKLTLTRTFFGKDIDGDGAVAKLAMLLTMGPAENSELEIAGKTLYATSFDVAPWANADGVLTVVYTEAKTGVVEGTGGFGPAQISGGTTLEQAETEFDAANLAKPYAERTPIAVTYDKESDGAPGALEDDGGTAKSQGARVPILLANSAITYSRVEASDPSARSRRFVGATNNAAFKGVQKGRLLCIAYTFNSADGGQTYSTSISFAYNPAGWTQFARYVVPETGRPPPLTNNQLKNNNGIKEVTVQGEANFNELAL